MIEHPFSRPELLRYSRHFVLPEVGLQGQMRLREAKVLVIGAGGLGSPVTLYLAAAGVGTLGLVDFDVVDASNLQRQLLHGTDDIGRSKLDSATDRLREVNPHVTLETHATRLCSENALEILEDYDVVVDGTDNFPTRYLVNDACVLLGKPNVYGSIYRFEGQVSLFDGRTGPCYRCLFREPPPPGLVPSCAEGGVLGVLPGIIGSMQAMEAIKLLLGVGDSLLGRLLLFDALDMTWRELRIPRDSTCPACGDSPTVTELIDYEVFCGVVPPSEAVPTEEGVSLSVTELKGRLDRDEDLVLLDVREEAEWYIANLSPQGARLIPLGELAERVHEVPRERDVVVYCRSGARSMRGRKILLEAGFDNVLNLTGGILAWQEEIDPTLVRY